MATVKELKATARPAGGKGAARAERRAGRVPGVIYGNNQPPVTISVDDTDLRQRILAGRFLTTIYDIDLEGKKHRVIPRDFHLDPAAQLNAATVAAMNSLGLREQLNDLAATLVTPERRTPDYLQGFVKSEWDKWGAAIRAGGAIPK